jgi:hypothetical protein
LVPTFNTAVSTKPTAIATMLLIMDAPVGRMGRIPAGTRKQMRFAGAAVKGSVRARGND